MTLSVLLVVLGWLSRCGNGGGGGVSKGEGRRSEVSVSWKNIETTMFLLNFQFCSQSFVVSHNCRRQTDLTILSVAQNSNSSFPIS